MCGSEKSGRKRREYIFVGVYLFVKRVVWWEEEEGVWREEEIINLGTLCLAVEQTFTLQESTISYSIYKYFFIHFNNNPLK